VKAGGGPSPELLRTLHRALSFYRDLGLRRLPDGRLGRVEALLSAAEGPPLPGIGGPPSCPMPGDERAKGRRLRELRAAVGDCRRCALAAGRRQIVFGAGDPCAELMFVGEGPGREEDLRGSPFVGPAGELLTRIIAAMGFRREEVYIANIVKCRPPGNREPRPEEIGACIGFLRSQIEIVSPRVIVALGRVAAQSLLGNGDPLSTLRGRFHEPGGPPVMVTYHPAYLLRNPGAKKTVWQDVQQVMRMLGKPLPGKRSG